MTRSTSTQYPQGLALGSRAGKAVGRGDENEQDPHVFLYILPYFCVSYKEQKQIKKKKGGTQDQVGKWQKSKMKLGVNKQKMCVLSILCYRMICSFTSELPGSSEKVKSLLLKLWQDSSPRRKPLSPAQSWLPEAWPRSFSEISVESFPPHRKVRDISVIESLWALENPINYNFSSLRPKKQLSYSSHPHHEIRKNLQQVTQSLYKSSTCWPLISWEPREGWVFSLCCISLKQTL